MKELFLLGFILLSKLLYGQQYSYTHYDLATGLPGVNVYSIFQDKEGNMWFGTDAGLCRYDGSRFKVFTVADGLPDNEIFNISQDSQGRIWLMPFRSVCYYYNGKFYTPENTDLLKKVTVQDRLLGSVEDSEHNIWLYENKCLYKISPDKEVSIITAIDSVQIYHCVKVSACPEGGIYFSVREGLFHYEKGKLTSKRKAVWTYPDALIPSRCVALSSNTVVSPFFESNLTRAISYKYNTSIALSPPGTNSISIVSDSTFFVCTPEGAYCYNFLDEHQRGTAFLKGKNVACAYQDREGNVWFSVLGDGLYRLGSFYIREFILARYSLNNPVTFLGSTGGEFIIGSENPCLLTTKDFVKVNKYECRILNDRVFPYSVRFAKKMADGSWLVAEEQMMKRYNKKWQLTSAVWLYAKYIHDPPDDEIIVATNANVLRLNENDLSVLDTVWNGRPTAVFEKSEDSLYVGTLNGLYFINNKKTTFLGASEPGLRSRISAMCASATGDLWACTSGTGVMKIDHHKVSLHISEANGLLSNICYALVLDNNNNVWVGTNRGLNKITLNGKSFSILPFTTADGLLTNRIQHLMTSGDTLYAGTLKGVNFFDTKGIDKNTTCYLYITEVLVNEKQIPVQAIYNIKDETRDFRVEFAAISFRSEKNINYKYRLKGLDDDSEWRSVAQPFIHFPSLPYGNYALEITATNKYGVTSKPVSIDLSVSKPFYKTIGFFFLASVLVTFLATFILQWKYVMKQKEEQEKISQNNKIIQLEQMALRAQMNPHFIFNCLSSLQQLIYSREVKEANKLLTGFASLIRQTLDNSMQVYITLEEEIKYLTMYLQVEQIRFDYKFSFVIHTAPDIDTMKTLIPNMILQPFVENSIRHGVTHKPTAEGKIHIAFTYEDSLLICTVTDNGVGRAQAAIYKGKLQQHESKGVGITSRRIELLNSFAKQNITLTTIDLMDENSNPCGTKVIVKILDSAVIHD